MNLNEEKGKCCLQIFIDGIYFGVWYTLHVRFKNFQENQ